MSRIESGKLAASLQSLKDSTANKMRERSDPATKDQLDALHLMMGWADVIERLGSRKEWECFCVDTRVSSPSAEVRLVDDNESDAPEAWSEVEINGKKPILTVGDMILRRK